MRCSLALVWNDSETGKAEAIEEMSEKELNAKLVAACVGVLDKPSLWERIKRVFRIPKYELVLSLRVGEVLQEFKDRSMKAHLNKVVHKVVW